VLGEDYPVGKNNSSITFVKRYGHARKRCAERYYHGPETESSGRCKLIVQYWLLSSEIQLCRQVPMMMGFLRKVWSCNINAHDVRCGTDKALTPEDKKVNERKHDLKVRYSCKTSCI